MRIAFLVTILALLSATARAQIDPSSAMLLNAGRADVRDGGLDSGRYTVKPRSEVIHTTTVHKTEVKTRVEETAATSLKPAPNQSQNAQQNSAQNPPPNQAQGPNPSMTPLPPAQASSQAVTVAPSPAPTPTQEAIAAQDDDDQDDAEPVVAKQRRDERRFTMLELSFAPGYLYNDSQSTFAPRNYFLNAPSMSVDASVWTSPNFGVHTGFNGTLNANVSDSLDNTRNAAASEQWFSAGAHARSFFGDSAMAPTLQFGLDYREFEFRVPSDTVLRNKLTTTGLILLLDAELPTGGLGAWVLGGEFGPKLSHRESSNATEFRTGDDVQTTSVGVHIGSRFRFDHSQQLFWKVSYSVEKSLYSGTTSVNDPVTGYPQTNVAVTNTFTLFQLGYTWSN